VLGITMTLTSHCRPPELTPPLHSELYICFKVWAYPCSLLVAMHGRHSRWERSCFAYSFCLYFWNSSTLATQAAFKSINPCLHHLHAGRRHQGSPVPPHILPASP
jgi:hypothetical protein